MEFMLNWTYVSVNRCYFNYLDFRVIVNGDSSSSLQIHHATASILFYLYVGRANFVPN